MILQELQYKAAKTFAKITFGRKFKYNGKSGYEAKKKYFCFEYGKFEVKITVDEFSVIQPKIELLIFNKTVGTYDLIEGQFQEDQKHALELLRRLMEIDDVCSYCSKNPKTGVCENSEKLNIAICYEGVKAYAKTHREEDE